MLVDAITRANGRLPMGEMQHRLRLRRSPVGHDAVDVSLTSLVATVEALQAELIKLEGLANGHRASFEFERDRVGRIMAELLRATADTMTAVMATALKRFAEIHRPWEL
jgi:hypothetical protein